MKRLLIIAFVAAAWTNTAVAETFDWSGIYGGVSIGARWSDMDYSSPYGMYQDYWSASGSGFTGGAFLGYNFTYGNLVFGPDVNVSFSESDADSFPEVSQTYRSEKKLRSKSTVTTNMRVGYAFGHFLPYITAGYAKAWYHLSYASSTNYAAFHWTDKFERAGWNVGVGTDWALTDNLLARAEYKFIDLGNEEIPGSNGWSRDFKQQTATLGIAYKF